MATLAIALWWFVDLLIFALNKRNDCHGCALEGDLWTYMRAYEPYYLACTDCTFTCSTSIFCKYMHDNLPSIIQKTAQNAVHLLYGVAIPVLVVCRSMNVYMRAYVLCRIWSVIRWFNQRNQEFTSRIMRTKQLRREANSYIASGIRRTRYTPFIRS